jgi:hypothetical protein
MEALTIFSNLYLNGKPELVQLVDFCIVVINVEV